MDYTQLTQSDVHKMLATIGVDALEDLFAGIDPEYRIRGLLNIPAGLSEMDLIADLKRLAGKNRSIDQQISFLGGGIYDHLVPTIVDALAGRGEFLTAYTPYQAEASQGILQAFYEFQTMVCALTGMDVSNASLYELASATAEAAFMASAVTGRNKVIVSAGAHPDVRQVLRTYTSQSEVTLDFAEVQLGLTDVEALRARLDDDTAAVVVQHPSFLGNLEDMPGLAGAVHDAGGLLIAAVDPISCGLLRRPGDYGADVVVAEGQSLGIPQSYGGPALGLLATRSAFLRKIPGRLVGQTTDRDGRRGFCLTLQAREQHIRREKASSNICTNQGLLALRASIYMSAMGRRGISTVARQCFEKAHYAAARIAELPGFELAFKAPFFKEFAIRSEKDVAQVLKTCQQNGILAGLALSKWYPQLSDCLLVAVTEKRTREEIDLLVEVLSGI